MLRVLYFIKNQDVREFIIIFGVTLKAAALKSQPEINGFVEDLVIFYDQFTLSAMNSIFIPS